MAQKRTDHIVHDDEIEIGPLQLQLILGSSWKDDIRIAVNSFFCDCGAPNKKLINYKSYLNDLNDITLKGWCNSCKTIASRYMETGERKSIEIITNKIRKFNKE